MASSRGAVAPLRNRWFADSLLEGDGFELPVPRAMQARLEAKIAGFGCMSPSIICGCRRWPSAKAQSEISEPNPYRARNRKFESISLQRRVRDEPMSGLWHPDRRDLLAPVVSAVADG